MIQRKQSIFLLLASIAFFLLFAFDFATSDQSTPGVLADKIYNVFDNPVLIGLTALGGAISLVTIFLFNNRPLQMRLGYLLMVLSILLPLVAFLLIYNEKTTLSSGTNIEDGIAIYLPILSLVMAFFANRFIKSDENLVRDSNRLR